MKIRHGYVSNSSSSSFIISYEEKEELLNNVKKMMKRYKTKGMDKIEKEEYLNCYNSQLDKWLHVDTVGDIKDKLNLPYWHRGCDIAYNDDLVIYDDVDNFIPEEVAKKIIKKYHCKSYNLHMG